MLPNLQEIQGAAKYIYRYIDPTPQISWPLLDQLCHTNVWVKHENHLPTGSFKVRGGLWFAKNKIADSNLSGIVAATRGNHGQSVAFAAQKYQVPATIVVPEGNNAEKNAAMIAYGANLIVHGNDFDDARLYAEDLASSDTLMMVPSFDPLLVCGVATYGLELFSKLPALKRVYVPIGLGSGICGIIAARDALQLETEIIGVVASAADAYLQSFESGKKCETSSAQTIADGLAVRTPNDQALAVIQQAVTRIVAVSDAQISTAMKSLFVATHNVAEGAGAAAFAALIKDQSSRFSLGNDAQVAVVVSGGNVSSDIFKSLF